MSKALVGFLIGIGFILFILGLLFGSTAAWVIGLLMLLGGLYLGLRPGGILRKDQVIDNWAILIGNAQGQAEQVLQETESLVKESKAPSLNMERRQMAPGIMRGLLGITREFLVVTNQQSFRMVPYQIFVNARDYGDNLDVSWHLTFRPSLWQAILSLIPYVNVIPKTLSDLDLFDEQDLRAYATNAHHCLLKAVEKLMSGLDQDPSKIDRRSRGFLGIS